MAALIFGLVMLFHAFIFAWWVRSAIVSFIREHYFWFGFELMGALFTALYVIKAVMLT